MKLSAVLLLVALTVGCGGYGSNYNSMGGGAAPHISALTPNNVAAGNAVNLTITGSGFTSGSVVYWGVTPIAAASTGYGSSTQVTAQISASQTANPGMVMVYVHTAAGNSNSLPFTIN